jgi:glycosyltransferase involved in cell wall biosynthesis
MAKVSVCLPTYNGERYLAAAIESILGQTFDDFNLIIIDDCSRDASVEIANQYAQKDKRVSVAVNGQNVGLFANYNCCIGTASGEYVKLFAQDDVLEPTMLERQVRALEDYPQVKLVASAKRWIGSDGNEIQVLRPFSETRLIPGKDVIRFNLIQLGNWVGEPSTVMFRRADAGSGFDTDIYHYGDIDYWFRIVENGEFLYLDEVLCSFRRHDGSTTTRNLSGLYFVLDMMHLGKKYRSYCEELGESQAHFMRRALELAARHVHHLVKTDGLSAEAVLAAGSHQEQDADETRAFKELSFNALEYLSELLAERHSLLCTINDLNEIVQDVRSNPWWRATNPLRKLSGKEVRGIDPDVEKISSGRPALGVVVAVD